MKVFKKLLIVFFLLLLALFISLSVYIKVYGKDFLLRALHDALGREVQIGKLSYQFPAGLNARDVYAKELLQAQNIKIQFDPKALSEKRLDIASLEFVRPVFMVTHRQQESAGHEEPAKGENPLKLILKRSRQRASALPVDIQRVVIKKGRIHYQDLSHQQYSFTLDDVDLKAVRRVSPSGDWHTTFQMVSRLEKENSPFSQSRLEGSGWLNLAKMDMETKLNIDHPDGKAQLSANIVSHNNDLTVEGQVHYSGLLNEQQTLPDMPTVPLQESLMAVLPPTDVEVGAKFSFSTKMDDFQLSKVRFSGLVATDSVAE